MQKAAEDLRNEAKRKAEEKEKYINAQVPELNTTGMNQGTPLCPSLFSKKTKYGPVAECLFIVTINSKVKLELEYKGILYFHILYLCIYVEKTMRDLAQLLLFF